MICLHCMQTSRHYVSVPCETRCYSGNDCGMVTLWMWFLGKYARTFRMEATSTPDRLKTSHWNADSLPLSLLSHSEHQETWFPSGQGASPFSPTKTIGCNSFPPTLLFSPPQSLKKLWFSSFLLPPPPQSTKKPRLPFPHPFPPTQRTCNRITISYDGLPLSHSKNTRTIGYDGMQPPRVEGLNACTFHFIPILHIHSMEVY